MHKIIFITGGSASGKTHLANQLIKHLGDRALLVSQDSFYKTTPTSKANFDIPEAFDFEVQRNFFKQIRKNGTAMLPTYDFVKHTVTNYEEIKAPEFIVFEGLFTFYDFELTKQADFKIFVDTPADTRLLRRIFRDVKERGRNIETVINRWVSDVQPSYKKFISNMKKHSDIIIPWSSINNRAIRSILASVVHINNDVQTIIKK